MTFYPPWHYIGYLPLPWPIFGIFSFHFLSLNYLQHGCDFWLYDSYFSLSSFSFTSFFFDFFQHLSFDSFCTKSHPLSFFLFSTHNSFHTLFSFGFLFHSHPQLMHFALVEVHNVRCQTKAKIKVTFDSTTLNLGFWPKSRCTCPRRDRGQDNILREGELGESKEMVNFRLKYLDHKGIMLPFG